MNEQEEIMSSAIIANGDIQVSYTNEFPSPLEAVGFVFGFVLLVFFNYFYM